MPKAFLFSTLLLSLTSCSTLNDSLQLGALLGGAAGAASTYAGFAAGSDSPRLSTLSIGTGIGIVAGVTTAYFTHQKVAADRADCQVDQPEMYFGDLPPNPFSIPKPQSKKGSNR